MYGRKSFIILQLIICILFVVIFYFFPFDAENTYKWNYIIDTTCALTVVVLYVLYIARNGFDIFDPIGIITFIYGTMYFVMPMYDIATGNYTWFGYSLFPYGIKSSLIALVGYFSFYFFYASKLTGIRRLTIRNRRTDNANGKVKNGNLVVAAILFFYCFCFAANLFYLLRSGYGNITYILTMGIFGNGNSGNVQQNSIGFIAMFSYCLPTLVLLYWQFGKSKILTVVLFMLMVMMQVTRGFRFLVVQIAISFAAYYYLSRKERPRLGQLLLLFLLLMIPVILMTMFRDSVRSGSGMTLSDIHASSIQKAIEDSILDNFRIYNNFYGLVHAVPQKYGYVYGRQIIIGTIVMVVPRVIWPGKISSQAGVDLDSIIGARLANTGQAYPGLGEFYYAFGTFGVIFFMAIYGVWMCKVKKKYMSTENRLEIVKFSVLLASNLQILIRGYTPSNFWYLVFSLLPVFMVQLIENIRFKR